MGQEGTHLWLSNRSNEIEHYASYLQSVVSYHLAMERFYLFSIRSVQTLRFNNIALNPHRRLGFHTIELEQILLTIIRTPRRPRTRRRKPPLSLLRLADPATGLDCRNRPKTIIGPDPKRIESASLLGACIRTEEETAARDGVEEDVEPAVGSDHGAGDA